MNATHPLQTLQWANFRKAWGNEVWKTPFGFITIHRTPITGYKIGIFEKGNVPTEKMLRWLKTEGTKRKLVFIKLEPSFAKATDGQAKFNQLTGILKKNGCIPGKTLFTPTTFWINLTKSEEELMKSFHPKTRYNIRYAQKKDVVVKEDSSDSAFERYLSLMRETVQRQGFYAHSEKYHRLMWRFLHSLPTAHNSSPIAHLLTAIYQNEITTAWILFVYDKVLYYPYGASSEKHKNVMANNLMMWEAIKFGKKMGCTTFDLWGREEGKGFTKFKEGFSPQVVEFLGSWDLIINKPIYKIYKLAEFLRWRMLKIRSKFIKPAF